MNKKAGTVFDLPVLRKILSYAKPYKQQLYLSIILTVVLSCLAPVRPYLTQLALDKYVAAYDYSGLSMLIALMFGVLILQTAIQFYHTMLTSILGQRVVRDMRIKLFNRIISFRLPYYDKTPVGTPVTRTISDIETVADVFSDGIIVIIGDILQLAAIIGYMFYSNWQLTLISLSTLPLLLVATNVFKNGIKRSFSDVRTAVASLNVFVQEHLTGMRIVKLFNREKEEMEGFRVINEKHKQAHIRSVWYYSIFFPVVELLSAISIGLIVWWAAKDAISGNTTFGEIVAFIMYINLLFRPIRELADKFNTLQMGMVSSERIFGVMEAPESESLLGKINAENIKGEIEFRNVWFAYNEEDWVLRDVSFKVEAGSTLAIVGPTGAGKSSIISLINRFYPIQKGQILIDGVDINDYDLTSLRKRISLVLQDVFLFSDTISGNISMMDNKITEEQIMQCAAEVGADKFIEQLPGKTNYSVGERGALLSMGQRQLLSFIRAQVNKPAILILDEATSSIDSESERLIIRATNLITRNRTSIVIAHRLSTIRSAGNIIVLEKGKIAESGNHEELLQNKGLYYKLHQVQFI